MGDPLPGVIPQTGRGGGTAGEELDGSEVIAAERYDDVVHPASARLVYSIQPVGSGAPFDAQ